MALSARKGWPTYSLQVASDATGEIDHLPQKLTPESRIVSGVVGVLSISAGTFAIFYKNNNGGSIALVAVGAAFLLMAITGFGIRSLKIGPNEIVMDTLNVARQLRLQGDDEGAAEAIESLIKTPTPLLTQPVADTSMSRSFLKYNPSQTNSYSIPEDYDNAVRAALNAELSGRGLVLPDMSANTQRFDFLVRASEKTFGVEIRLGDRIRFDAFAQSMNLLLQTTATSIDGVLVVVNSSPEAITNLRDVAGGLIRAPSQFVAWRTSDDPKVLLEAIHQLVVVSSGIW
jgi:hypothetical protein